MPEQLNIENAYVIGQANFDSWSNGFDADGYLKVLPHSEIKVAYYDPFLIWQQDHLNYRDGVFKEVADDGSYYSSWGPDKELDVTLTMDELEQLVIGGLGILEPGDHFIDWLNKATPYDYLRAYNSRITGPMLIVDPGDTIKITLINNLDGQVSNLHTHGLHVSPLGDGDNVLVAVEPNATREMVIELPDDHFIGPDWYHPHLHGSTNDQVAAGLGGYLLVNPSYDLPDLDKYNPVDDPAFFMAINTFGIQQQNRPSSPTDPLNQSADPNFELPAGTPLEFTLVNGEPVYTLSEAPFVGYNAKPVLYDPVYPQGNPTAQPPTSAYGQGGLSQPVENAIHTVNGQYNPTIEAETGRWNLFSFANMSVNSFHMIQLLKKETDGTLTPQTLQLVAIDGDAAGSVEGVRREVTVSPVLNPGSRVTFQYWFEDAGEYYFISNATDEILGDQAPLLSKNGGFNDGHLIWGPQVLTTIEVTGESITQGPLPEPYDVLVEQARKIDELVDSALAGDVTQERTFTWSANIGNAIAAGRNPDDTDVASFEGTYTINGEYYSTQTVAMPALTLPMLGTNEIWTLINTSGISDPSLGPIDIPLLEWHPFHIHQNDFVVLEINGIKVEDIEQNYLARVLSDTIALSPTYAPGSATPANPYGTPQYNGLPSEVKILMEFQDYPGAYVNHCHILFHEDAGMMAAVRVILNTESTWLGISQDKAGPLTLFLASDSTQAVQLNPYGNGFGGGIEVAIADINYKVQTDANNNNVNDNITDVATIQKKLTSSSEEFTVKIFDGQSLQGQTIVDSNNSDLLLTQFRPFQDLTFNTEQQSAIATGDLDGDGFADIVVGIGGGLAPRLEIYSGKDYQLMAKLNPFHHESFTGAVNLAIGDVNGDNYDDIIVGQGDGGQGLVEAYSGLLLTDLIESGQIDNLTGNDVAHDTALFSQKFQPYGTDYTGEVKVTSGYILSRPEIPNGQPIQTSHANITTLAIADVPQGTESIQVWTYLGGGHGHSSSENGDHTTEPELRLDKSITPANKILNISGSFADIPNGQRGEPVLFAQTASGETELIHLTSDQGVLETIPISNITDTATQFTPATEGSDKGSLVYDLTSVAVEVTTRTDDAALAQTDALFYNLVGLYQVENAAGAILDTLDLNGNGQTDDLLNPNDPGYARTAITNRVNNFLLQAGGEGDPNKNTNASEFGDVLLQGGRFYAPFVIANGGDLIPENGTPQDAMNAFLAQNPDNVGATLENYLTHAVSYFTFGSANPDGTEHLQNRGNNIFGFEDLPGNLNVSDFDFNDSVFQFVFNV